MSVLIKNGRIITATDDYIADIFIEYGLQFAAYKKESKFEIEKNIDGYINKYRE